MYSLGLPFLSLFLHLFWAPLKSGDGSTKNMPGDIPWLLKGRKPLKSLPIFYVQWIWRYFSVFFKNSLEQWVRFFY
jgi:hypothetical protein